MCLAVGARVSIGETVEREGVSELAPLFSEPAVRFDAVCMGRLVPFLENYEASLERHSELVF